MEPKYDSRYTSEESDYGAYSTDSTKTSERSAADLMRELINEAGAWIRAEATLMRMETRDSVSEAQHALTSIAIAGAVIHAGVFALVACAVIALDRIWPTWLAALVVGVVLTGAGAVTLSVAKNRLKGKAWKPDRTWSSIQGTKNALQDAHLQTKEKWQ